MIARASYHRERYQAKRSELLAASKSYYHAHRAERLAYARARRARLKAAAAAASGAPGP